MSFLKTSLVTLTNLTQKLKIPLNITESEIYTALLGSLLLSIAILMYYYIFGKVAGRRSLVNILLTRRLTIQNTLWLNIIAGIVFASAFVKQLQHEHYINFWPFDTNSFANRTSEGQLAIAGVLVGFGSSLAGNCTLGHAVIGVAKRRLSSFVAVVIVFVSAYLVNSMKLVKSVPYALTERIQIDLPRNLGSDYYINGCLIVPFLLFVLLKDKSLKGLIKSVINFVIGVFCGLGLMIGGFSQRTQVLSSMSYNPRYWNPTVALCLLGSIVINSFIFSLFSKKQVKPVFATQFENDEEKLSLGLILGSVCFGIGWGLSGISPESYYTLVPLVNLKIVVYWGLAYVFGLKFGDLLRFVAAKIVGVYRRITVESGKARKSVEKQKQL